MKHKTVVRYREGELIPGDAVYLRSETTEEMKKVKNGIRKVKVTWHIYEVGISSDK